VSAILNPIKPSPVSRTPLPGPELWANAAPKSDRPLVWVNGKMLPQSQAMVSVYDHGLLYGDGIFEGIRIYRGRIFKCAQHLDRLYHCADQIKMKIPITREQMEAVQRECISVNGITEGYIRLVVTRGFGTLGLDPRRCPVPGVICIADQINLYPPEFYETGMKVIVAKRPKTAIAALDPRVKSLNYLNNILAKMEAIDADCHEAIMISPDGFVAECTGDNIFIIKGGKLFTPPTDVGLLPGITRQFVIDTLARECGLSCEQKRLKMADVTSADEVFLTGTAAEIIGVPQVGDQKISNGEGPITNKLRMKFRQIVTSDNVPED
jgi:branched-chain amino acid aminotransferase